MLKLNTDTKLIITTDGYYFHGDNARLKPMRPLRRQGVGNDGSEQIGERKILLHFTTTWAIAKQHVVFMGRVIARFIRHTSLGDFKSLPVISKEQQGKRNMQSRVGIIPSKPLGMCRGSEYQEQDCYV